MKIINCNTFNNVLVQVHKGDTIEGIAQTYNTNTHNILRNNPSIDLYEGEVVKIVRNTKNMHVVKPMESLNSIAVKYNTTTDKLIKINNLKSTRLFVGQMIEVD